MCAAGSQESQVLLTVPVSCWGVTARLCLFSPVENTAFVLLDKC